MSGLGEHGSLVFSVTEAGYKTFHAHSDETKIYPAHKQVWVISENCDRNYRILLCIYAINYRIYTRY